MPPATTPTTCNRSKTTLVPNSDSDSVYFPSAICPLARTHLQKCLFKSKMRITKRSTASFCLSLLSLPPSDFQTARIFTRFHSPVLCYRLSSSTCDRSSGKRRVSHNTGANQFRGSYKMDGTGVDDKTSQFQNMNVSESGQDPCIWSSPGGGHKINIGRRIFCNRSLNMRNIVAVGFDMDYTLAQYKPETFESLAYEGTIRKLVYDLGYPSELLEWTFDWKYMVRGLVLDKKRGNILKMDRHKYVKVAYHGFRELSKEDKVATYGNSLIRDAFDEPDYALIDTLFSLAEAYLFAQLVDFKDNNPGKVPEGAE
ncbi:hypothetical protein U1Q18_016160 [Sarracenia purpurea var. burkii]